MLFVGLAAFAARSAMEAVRDVQSTSLLKSYFTDMVQGQNGQKEEEGKRKGPKRFGAWLRRSRAILESLRRQASIQRKQTASTIKGE
jgi:hypothetical protein